MKRAGTVVRGTVLVDGELVDGPVVWEDDTISSIGGTAGGERGLVIDAQGCLVLPGLVDLHGDAFERCLMPRPGVRLDASLAVQENTGHLVASGITTAFVSVTDSFEPGLRSRETLREIAMQLRSQRDASAIDQRLHVRHEVCHTADHGELLDWIADGTLHLLSINDHAPGSTPDAHRIRPSAVMLGRCGLSEADADRMLLDAADRRAHGLEQVAELVRCAHHSGTPVGSHDPATEADLERDRALAMDFAEFPMSLALAERYRAAAIDVVLGAPNVVRGGSHLGGLRAAAAVEQNAVDVLCSDYHYPSMVQAPFLLPCPLPEAWGLVAGAAARVARLDDRGVLAAGLRADLVVVEPRTGDVPARVRAVVSGGRIATWTN
jgi:alpha-D-ribose 1-methylphosphonate 5-triphosphate diphosphatase